MLMQTFKSATELGIAENQRAALMKTLVLLETGKLKHVPDVDGLDNDWLAKGRFSGKFNMGEWITSYKRCGTVACIGGTAELVGKVRMKCECGSALHELFYPSSLTNWDAITPAIAAKALRSYLSCGDARWKLAVK
jgi:hypothetical protein